MSEANMAANSTLSKLLSLNGLCAIYKKEGPTSANVLNEFKETLLKEAGIKNVNPRKRQKHNLKVGHGGTLDSPASGVLVVGVGKGTKMLSSMLTGSKKYTAVAELGKATDTLDATGKVILEKDFDHITSMDIEEKLKEFTGDTMQVPPLYSALKKDGQRMSRLMNTGQKVEAKPARAVTVYNLTLQEFNPPLLTLDIECGGGFYVRSLIDDLGKALSSCAHMKSLVRTKQGQFTLEEHALQEEQWTLEDVMRTLQPCPDTEQNEKHSKDKSKRKCGKKSEEKPDKKSEEKPDKKSEEKPDQKSEEKPDQKSEEKCDNISEEKSEQKSEEDFVKTT